jgi:putative PIG3 family NAD(P)H quinone oxidoreductase
VRAVAPAPPGGEETPRLVELADPVAGPGEVVLDVRATALNRADLLQLRGQYPPPAGESDVPGLEAAGVISALGPGVAEGAAWRVGDAVAALLAGGGHAEKVAVPAGQLLPLPRGWSFEEGAALPEAALTAWTNLVAEGKLAAGETVLVTGATSGVGTFVVQLARELGARVFAAGRDPERLERLRPLGADAVFRLGADLGSRVRAATDGHGADLAIDLVGGENFGRALDALAAHGRLVLVGLMAGRSSEADLGAILRKQLRVTGSLLRPRPRPEKAALVAAFHAFAAPLLAERKLLPVIDRVFDFDAIADAYRCLQLERPLGKVVVRVAGRNGRE